MASGLRSYACRAVTTALVIGSMTAAVGATTYYVDYEGGDDSHDGQRPEQAFKHAPIDPRAGERAAEVELEPGDVLRFRGGVAYRGSLELEASGSEEEPIVLDGNAAGDFGEGRAILDGGRLVEGWRPVESAEQVGGNANWQRMFYADIDVDISPNMSHDEFVVHRKAPTNTQAPWQRVPLFDGEEGLLPIAQSPKPSDPFYPDLPGDFYVSPDELDVRVEEDESILTDEQRLTAEAADAYVGRFVGVHGGNNHVYFAMVREYDPETNSLVLPRFDPSTYSETEYAFYNAVDLIEEPGEWAIRPLGDGRSRVYLLPEHLEDGQPANIAFPEFQTAVTISSGASHVEVRGFVIQRYGGGGGGVSVPRGGGRSRDITVADCEIRFLSGHAGVGPHHADEITVENCYIHHNPGWTTGIFLNRINDYEVRNNRLVKNSGSGIRHYEAKRGVLEGNVILEHTGMHASAINLYAGCEDVLLARNIVQRSNAAVTTGDVRRIHLVNNVFTSGVGIWPHSYNEDIYFLNNYIGGAVNIHHENARRMVFKNNILSRFDGYPPDDTFTFSHNIYLESKRGLAEGEFIVRDVDEVVRGAGEGDFQPVAAGPTLDMGTDVSAYYPREQFPDVDFDVDLAGEPRVHGEAIDIGPYERAYEPGELEARGSIVTGPDAEPADPIEAYSPIADAEAMTLRGVDFTDEGGGSVNVVSDDDQARHNHIRFWNDEGHALAYRVAVPEAGEFKLRLRYAADLEAPRQIEVNGEVQVDEVTIPVTGGWGTFEVLEVDRPLSLEAGENTLRLTSLGGQGCNLDMVELVRDGEVVASVSAGDFVEEEGGSVEVVPAPHHGLFSHWNDDGHWLEWTVEDAEAGLYKVVVRYATLATAPRSVEVNGEVVEGLESFVLDRTPGWRHVAEAALPAPLELDEGRNVIRFTNVGGGGLNFDEIRLVPVE